MEELITKLNDIYNIMSGLVAIIGIFMIISLFAVLILFFWYYDVCKKEEHKRLRKQIEREIKEEQDKWKKK